MEKYYNLIENLDAFKALENDIARDRLTHFYLFVTEDSLSANIFSYLLSLKVLANNNIANLKRYPREGEKLSVATVDEIIDDSLKAPAGGDKKIYSVLGAEGLSPQAQSKFLKTLEEPPKGVIIFLLAKTISNILLPIQSRSRKIILPPLDKDAIFIALSNSGVESGLLQTAIDYGQGNLEKVDDFLTDKSKQILFKVILDSFSEGFTSREALSIVSKLLPYKGYEKDIIYILELLFRDALVVKKGCAKNILLTKSIAKLQKAAALYSEAAIHKILELLRHLYHRAVTAANTNSFFDELVLKIAEYKAL